MAQDPFYNGPHKVDPAELFGGVDRGVMTGGTSNSLPGYSVSDEARPVLSQGSASAGAAPELTPDPFDNAPPDHDDM